MSSMGSLCPSVATRAGVEMGLAAAGVPHRKSGTRAAIDYLAETARKQGQEHAGRRDCMASTIGSPGPREAGP